MPRFKLARVLVWKHVTVGIPDTGSRSRRVPNVVSGAHASTRHLYTKIGLTTVIKYQLLQYTGTHPVEKD